MNTPSLSGAPKRPPPFPDTQASRGAVVPRAAEPFGPGAPPGDAIDDEIPASVDQATTGGTASGRIMSLAIVIMVGTGISRLLGLVRESIISDRFGSNAATDAFAIADNIQSTIFELTTNGVLQAAMIPALSGLLIAGAGGVRELRRAMGALLTLILIGTGTVSIAGIIWAPDVVHVMTSLVPGHDSPDPRTVGQATVLVRWILPAVPLLGMGSVLMAGLHAVGRPAAPSFGSATRNFVFIVVAVALSGTLGVRSLALGTVLGSLAIVLLQIPSLLRAGVVAWPSLRLSHPVVGTVTRLSLPVTVSLIITTIVTILDRNLAVNVSEGTVTAMRYATTLVQTILGLVAAAVSLASLPSLSRHHERDDHEAFTATLRRALIIISLLLIPVTLGLAALSRPIVGLVFQHGATDAAAAGRIETALLWYLPGTVAAGYAQILLFAFYARRNTLTPLVITATGAIAYAAVAFSLVAPLGMTGLVVANSAQWIVTLAGVLLLGRSHTESFSAMPWGIMGVCIVGGAASAGLAWVLSAATGASSGAASTSLQLAVMTIGATIGCVVYVGVVGAATRALHLELDLPERIARYVPGARSG